MSIPSADRAPSPIDRSPLLQRRPKVTTELPCRAGDEHALTLERAHAAAQAMSTTEWSPIIRRITCGFGELSIVTSRPIQRVGDASTDIADDAALEDDRLLDLAGGEFAPASMAVNGPT